MELSKKDLTRLIKERSAELGFSKTGIVPAEPLVKEKEYLSGWLGRGFHGEMRWMEREPEKRTDPKLLLPSARSIIVTALNYFTPSVHEDSAAKGKISRYAWGDDYHDIVGEKLRALLDWIKTTVAAADDEICAEGKNCPEGKICVDTAPMMDKAWAARAGLGWIGKHTNLITKEYGSWVFIGELLIDLELEYDRETVPDHCGTCTACLDACPTQAIVEPFIVDSNRCISYATIELRAPELPGPVAENLNGWLYGCDICQDVCPWNRFEQITPEKRFEPRTGNVSADLDEILNLSPEEYAGRFRRSAIKRAKLSGLQRNARTLKKENDA